MRNPGLSLPQQALALKSVYDTSRLRLGPTSLVWSGHLQPSALSERYLIEVSLKDGNRPVVKVIAPALMPDEKGSLPHIWEDGSLCLNTAEQWTSKMLLVDTIIPWSSEWLFHYEAWRGTGIWFGDGPSAEHPDAQAQLLHPANLVRAQNIGD